MMKLYHKSQIGVISNNMEEKFGLANVVDKHFGICYEVKDDMTLDQADFQCMVSGEDIMVAVKGQTGRSVLWKQHLLFLGNNYARTWLDNSGSISRRMAIIDFFQMVLGVDPNLLQKLDLEMPALILKFNLAYRSKVQEHGHRGAWEKADPSRGLSHVLPPYFHQTSARRDTHVAQVPAGGHLRARHGDLRGRLCALGDLPRRLRQVRCCLPPKGRCALHGVLQHRL
jgi:hypothetical protein